jgi:hypothetical protein
MPYKNQTSIVIPKETKDLLRVIKNKNETWDDLLIRLVALINSEAELVSLQNNTLTP